MHMITLVPGGGADADPREFNFTGDTSDLDRAFRDVTRRAEQQERQIARLERQQRDYQAQLRRSAATQRTQVDQINRTTSAASDSGSSWADGCRR